MVRGCLRSFVGFATFAGCCCIWLVWMLLYDVQLLLSCCWVGVCLGVWLVVCLQWLAVSVGWWFIWCYVCLIRVIDICWLML